MDAKTFLILGGYGNAGILIARYLLQYTNLNLIIAGRNHVKAIYTASQLNTETKSERVKGVRLDASQLEELREAFKKCDFVIVASSTAKYTENIVKACISAKIDYLDILLSTEKLKILSYYEEDIVKANLYFITDAGFHPGLPGVLVRYASYYFDDIEISNVASLIKFDWSNYLFSESTRIEMIEESKSYSGSIYKNNEWKKLKYSNKDIVKKFFFGEQFGFQNAYAMMLEEMRNLPFMIPSLKETAFYVNGFNWFTNYLILPLSVHLMKIYPKSLNTLSKVFEWSLKKFSEPPFISMLKVEAKGFTDNEGKSFELMISHDDAYVFTAIPVAACILQYLDGKLKKSGVSFMAHIVEPTQLLKDMEMMGIKLEFGHSEIQKAIEY